VNTAKAFYFQIPIALRLR